MSGEMSELLTVIIDLKNEVAELKAGLLIQTPANSTPARTSFSTAEVAKMIGKSGYTVMEYCRYGRIIAFKRAERRGGHAIWGITAEEVERIKNEGLLPFDMQRNNLN